MDKYSSLLQKSVNYGRNEFYDTDPWIGFGLQVKIKTVLSLQLSFTNCSLINQPVARDRCYKTLIVQ
jgi:hypothetical protein